MNLHLLVVALSGLFYAANGIVYKISTKYAVRDPLQLLFLIYLLQLPTSILVLPFTKVQFISELWLPFLLFNLAFFVGSIFVALAVVHLDASVFMPLFNVQVILTSLFAFFILGEHYSPLSYLLMTAIVLGGVLVTVDEKYTLKFNQPLIFFLIGVVLYSLSDAFGGRVVKEFGALNLRFWSSLFLTAFSVILVPFFGEREKVSREKLLPVSLVGFLGFLGIISLTFGFEYSVSISQALSRLSSVYALVIIIFLAKFKGDFLEAKPFRIYAVRLAGCLIMVAAAVGLLWLQ